MRRFAPIFLVLFLLLLLPVLRPAREPIPDSEIAQVSRALGVGVSAGTVVSCSDSHGGFHGDGLTFIEIAFPDDGFGGIVRGQWRALPLSGNLQALVYGVSGVGPISPGTGSPAFPVSRTGTITLRTVRPRAPTPGATSRSSGAPPTTSPLPSTTRMPGRCTTAPSTPEERPGGQNAEKRSCFRSSFFTPFPPGPPAPPPGGSADIPARPGSPPRSDAPRQRSSPPAGNRPHPPRPPPH